MEIAANVAKIREQLESACVRARRDPASVTLMAVSKGHSPDAIQAAADAGLNVFGESKVQEAKAKIPLCPGRLRWEMIGHLQSNKSKDAVALFQCIQSVDRLSLAEELNKQAGNAARMLPILLEVNAAGEASKFGYAPRTLIAELEKINALPRLEIYGLMTIAPYCAEPERARPFFRQLRELKEECEQILGAPLPQLSMGMSGDFAVAIEEGSTIVRIGTAIFGERKTLRRESI